MSAEFVDALKGYEYYLKQRGKASLLEINNYLVSHGRRPIQLRTYGHYRKLLANGFRSYIPINKFDVFQSLGRVQMAADRRRYDREKVQIPAQISSDGEKWIGSEIIDKSLVGLGIAIPGKLHKTKGTKLWVKHEGYDDIPAIMVWQKYDDNNNFTRFGVRAFEFVVKYQQEEGEIRVARLTGVIKIVREKEGDLDWENLFRILSETNRLIDAISALIYTIDDVMDTNIRLARSVLSSIKFGSPGELQTKVDLGIAEILKTLIEKFQYWSLDKKRYIEENRRKELENINYGVDVIRNAINLHKEAKEAGISDEAIRTILDPIKKVFNAKKLPRGLFDDGSLERAVLTERVMPVIAELIAGDDPDFKITVYKIEGQQQSTNESQ
jgi:hypothetical protein